MSVVHKILCLSLPFLMVSCGEQPLSSNGIIRGMVIDNEWRELEGVTVKAIGPYGKQDVLTGSQGEFEFTGMENGTYFLEFSRKNLGTRRLYNIQIFDDETVQVRMTLYTLPANFRIPPFVKVYMAPIPRSYPEQDWVCIQTAATMGNREPFNYGFEFILFFSKTPDVTLEKYDFILTDWHGAFWDNPICLYCNPAYLPFKKGEKLYIRAYAFNRGENPDQLDPYTGKPEFSTLDRTRYSNVIEFTMP